MIKKYIKIGNDLKKLSNVEMFADTDHRTFFESGHVLIKVSVQWIQFFMVDFINYPQNTTKKNAFSLTRFCSKF